MDIPIYEGGKSRIAGVSRVIKLSSNEAALGPSPKAVAAYGDGSAKLHRYPAGDSAELRAAIAEVERIDAARIICGQGSDEILCLLCRAYAGPGDEVIHTAHAFAIYRIYALSVGATPIAVAERNLTTDVDAILKAVTPATRVVFLANPNNPTGTYISAAEVERLRAGLRPDILLVLDAAYCEFMDVADYDSGMALAATADNVFVTRTFSKIHGLAALRIGWGYGHAAIIATLERLRAPFNVSAPAQAAAAAAIRDRAHFAKSVAHNAKWRAVMVQRLCGLGLDLPFASANFVLPRFDGVGGRTAAAADAFLQAKGIIARRVESYGLPQHLRITIGADDENEAVLNALTEFMESRRGG
jgi:histidinol-phosphate aminotransferase